MDICTFVFALCMSGPVGTCADEEEISLTLTAENVPSGQCDELSTVMQSGVEQSKAGEAGIITLQEITISRTLAAQ